MSVLRDREGRDYKLGVRELGLKGFLDAIGESPALANIPPALKTGTLVFGQTVILKDGKTVTIEMDEKTPSPGTRVIVYEIAKSCFYPEPQG